MNDRDKQLLIKIILDCFLLAIVGIPFIFIKNYLKPNKRGFFCDDNSIRYPYKPSTVPWIYLILSGIFVNLITILICEIIHYRRSLPIPETFFGHQIPSWIWSCYCLLGTFAFGMAVTEFFTLLGKYSIGRLRPNFIDTCKPNVDCSLSANINKYIIDFECQKNKTNDPRLSFPSGHSAMLTYLAVHFTIYLQARFFWTGSKLLRHTIQLIVLVLATFTCLSRAADYKHHATDIVAGAFIGIAVALITTKYVINYFSLEETLRTDNVVPFPELRMV